MIEPANGRPAGLHSVAQCGADIPLIETSATIAAASLIWPSQHQLSPGLDIRHRIGVAGSRHIPHVAGRPKRPDECCKIAGPQVGLGCLRSMSDLPSVLRRSQVNSKIFASSVATTPGLSAHGLPAVSTTEMPWPNSGNEWCLLTAVQSLVVLRGAFAKYYGVHCKPSISHRVIAQLRNSRCDERLAHHFVRLLCLDAIRSGHKRKPPIRSHRAHHRPASAGG